MVEFVIAGKIRRKRKVDSTLVHARAFTHALKGRPREMRTVTLFRLPRGSSVRSLREHEESLNACLLDMGV